MNKYLEDLQIPALPYCMHCTVTPLLTKCLKKMGAECYYFVIHLVHVGINTPGLRLKKIQIKHNTHIRIFLIFLITGVLPFLCDFRLLELASTCALI